MCAMPSAPAPYQPTPRQASLSPYGTSAAQTAMDTIRRRMGMAATINTGPAAGKAPLGPANTAGKSLLGM